MNALWTLFIEPLSHDFMQRALLAALLVGIVAAPLSCLVVLKGWSLMGDAISHAVLPGLVLASVLGLPLALGAFVSGLLCAVAAGYLESHTRLKPDTVLGIVFSGLFALGLVLFTKLDTGEHLLHVLFGNLLGVRRADLIEVGLIAAIVLTVVVIWRRDLMLNAFDPTHARAIGVWTRLLHYGLLAMIAATVVVALKAVGIILVVSMLITPGATALLLVRRFDAMLTVAVLAAIIPSLAGTILSFHMDAATGPTIVLLQSAGLILALAAHHALAWRHARTAAPPTGEAP